MKRNEILEQAKEILRQTMEQDGVHLETSLRVSGELWAVYLREMCVSADGEVFVGAEDVAAMLALREIGCIAAGGGTMRWIRLAEAAAAGGEAESEQ